MISSVAKGRILSLSRGDYSKLLRSATFGDIENILIIRHFKEVKEEARNVPYFNLLLHNFPKWSDLLLKSCSLCCQIL